MEAKQRGVRPWLALHVGEPLKRWLEKLFPTAPVQPVAEEEVEIAEEVVLATTSEEVPEATTPLPVLVPQELVMPKKEKPSNLPALTPSVRQAGRFPMDSATPAASHFALASHFAAASQLPPEPSVAPRRQAAWWYNPTPQTGHPDSRDSAAKGFLRSHDLPYNLSHHGASGPQQTIWFYRGLERKKDPRIFP